MRGDRVEIVIDAGSEVRTARFMASRILALVEHPATDRGGTQEVASPVGARPG